MNGLEVASPNFFFVCNCQSVDNFLFTARAYISASHGTIMSFYPRFRTFYQRFRRRTAIPKGYTCLASDSIRMIYTDFRYSPSSVLHYQWVYYAGHLGRSGHDGGTIHEPVLIEFLSQFDAPAVLLVEEEGHR